MQQKMVRRELLIISISINHNKMRIAPYNAQLSGLIFCRILAKKYDINTSLLERLVRQIFIL